MIAKAAQAADGWKENKMGRYYKLINIDKREFVEPWPLDCGAKLMEWSYCRAGMACALMNLMATRWKGDRVYVVGDYADLDNPAEIWYEKYREAADELGCDNLYGYATENFKDISSEVDSEYHGWKRIYNDRTRQFIDLSKCPIEWIWWDDETKEPVISSIAPLGLLLAMGNGRGGGDYRNSENEKLVGRWCASARNIEVTNDENVPHGYKEFMPNFTENHPLVPYTRAAELMEKMRKEKNADEK